MGIEKSTRGGIIGQSGNQGIGDKVELYTSLGKKHQSRAIGVSGKERPQLARQALNVKEEKKKYW